MFTKIFKSLFVFLFILVGISFAFGQEGRNPQKEDFPDSLKENLAKRRIKQDEEDFQGLVKKSEEAIKISEELAKSFEDNNKLSAEDTKKLEKLEKVVKKIRQELGAEEEKDEKQNEDRPSNLPNTLKSIKEKATNLLTELKKTGRFAISVAAVESSNAIFKLVKFLRLSKN